MKNKWLLAIVFVGVLIAIRGITAQNEAVIGDKREYSLLPKDREGKFPVQIPQYEGVDQLIVLSNRWIIVLTNNSEEVVQKVDELSKGKYMTAVKQWIANPIWWLLQEQIEPMQKQYYAQARVDVGEFDLDKASFYGIASKDDLDYKSRLNPSRATRYITSLADRRIPGELNVHWDHYSYLEMPKPMKNGKTYTVDVGNKKKVTFVFDEKATVSRAIKVNQVGYLPQNKGNKAFLGAFLREFGPHDFSWCKEFSVVDVNTGESVYKGPIKLRQGNPRVANKPGSNDPLDGKPYLYGEDVYEMDLSPISREGNYFITIPGVGRSWAFKISQDALAEAYYISTRGMYHQRCGIEIKQPYSPWPRIRCHTEPVYESQALPFIDPINTPNGYEVFDVMGYTIDYNKPHNDVIGGWHDAADWDKRIPHYANVYDLLYGYENAPQKFTDGQLNIPESGNGVPDILDEAEYGLSIWKRSMDEKGGVSGIVETWTHAGISDPNAHYALSKNTRWSSLIYAAGAAHYAELVKPFDAEKAKEYLDSAILAYQFGNDPKNSLGTVTIQAAKNRGEGDPYTLSFTEKNDDQIPYLIHAKMRLFLATGEESYLKDIQQLFDKALSPMVWPFNPYDCSSWLYWAVFNPKMEKFVSANMRKKWRDHYISVADKLVTLSQESAYYQSWPNFQDYWMSWGMTAMINQARNLMMGYILTKDEKYRLAAIHNINFMYGANPMGMSWTTGLGYTYPIYIQHEVSLNDGILDPVPGITIFGITERDTPPAQMDMMWKMKDGAGKEITYIKEANTKTPVWRRWWAHPDFNTSQNEFTVFETMTTQPACLGWLLPDGWQPSEELKNRQPRKDELLFGYWYMP